MKLFKNNSNEVYAYEQDGSQDHLIADDLTPITQEEADAIIKSNEVTLLNSLSYAKRRSIEYPSIGDQLDALFHAGVFPPEMAAQIQAIKDKYPKP